eukprot:scaffold207302_cov39-Tisochrysis_lutea.AAC.3
MDARGEQIQWRANPTPDSLRSPYYRPRLSRAAFPSSGSAAMTAAENIAKALELKEEGNAAFKAGDYKKAIAAYHQVRR